ncbi:MAG: DUF262 domain-containing protein [Rikenellaceae bacterium]|nr:DUF262 domain-containing protein [Rikenellaceae bacterium]
MKVELHQIKIRDLVNGYMDSNEEGVVGYGGLLDIRPKYQREFVYDDKQRNAVIDTVKKYFPLNVMYWACREDGTYEVLDGQQRTLSICKYVNGDYSIDEMYFHILPKDEQERILEYPLMVYFCEGEESEKLEWFETVNIAGERLSDQELRNAVYTGEWLTSAKRYFSKSGCVGMKLGDKYVKCEVNRQGLLELALRWISNGNIKQYMADHCRDTNANELWFYYNNVITWVQATFPTYRKEMKGLPWGEMYNEFGQEKLDSLTLDAAVKRLMMDDEIQNKKGIYQYLLDGREKHLNLRAFDDATKRTVYELQDGICPICKEHFAIEEMEGDHIMPWYKGGKTVIDNCQMLCRSCNREKSGK